MNELRLYSNESDREDIITQKNFKRIKNYYLYQ